MLNHAQRARIVRETGVRSRRSCRRQTAGFHHPASVAAAVVSRTLFGRLAAAALALVVLAGCADRPFQRLWYRKQWQEDERYGATLHTRRERLEALRDEAEDMDEPQQERVAARLIEELEREPSSLYRAAAVRSLGALSGSTAEEGLRRAQGDQVPSVRIAVCEAWTQKGGPLAVDALAQVIQQDADLDVRLAAARGLGELREDGVVAALGVALDDPDPALQYRAVQSLRQVTGRDFGASVPLWREYVHSGEAGVPEEISIAERLRSLF